MGIYTLPWGKQRASGKLLCNTGGLCDDVRGGMGVLEEGGDAGIQIPDSLHCNATL